MWCRAIVLTVLLAVGLGFDGFRHLVGHSVLRVVPDTRDQLDAVHDYLKADPALDVWCDSQRAGMPVDVRVSPAQREELVNHLDALGVRHSEFIKDLHSVVKEQTLRMPTAEASGDGTLNWKTYHPLNKIYQWMDELQEAHPGVVSVVDIGKTYEGRSMKGVIIKFAPNLPVAMIESGIHAREWIAHASATYFVDQILNSDQDDDVRKYEWHVFPTVNPDGYVHTWEKDRNWRKTRSVNWLIFRGVDANRNWPFHWMEAGTNRMPFSETYGGPRAESEPETRNLRQYVDKLAERMHAYISLHSYSQMLMFPWGHTSKHANTHEEMYQIAEKAIEAVTAVAGTPYSFGNIADTIYLASGNTIDYVYSKCVPYPFVFELRDNGTYGFMLPPEEIEGAASEAWAGVRVIVSEAYKAGVPARNPATCQL